MSDPTDRTVLTAAAWSVPVIATAAATPAMAVSSRTCNSTNRTTYFTWTLPQGTRFPTDKLSTNAPDLLFSFGDGLAGTRRITNKIIVRSLTRADSSVSVGITSPSSLPIDSSVVKDYDQGALSPDGIY